MGGEGARQRGSIAAPSRVPPTVTHSENDNFGTSTTKGSENTTTCLKSNDFPRGQWGAGG